jgi:hypothetical protein
MAQIITKQSVATKQGLWEVILVLTALLMIWLLEELLAGKFASEN